MKQENKKKEKITFRPGDYAVFSGLKIENVRNDDMCITIELPEKMYFSPITHSQAEENPNV